MSLVQVHYFGVLLRDTSGVWQILDDAGHQSEGLAMVSVDSVKRLVVTYPTVTKVGGFQVTSDETWCGKYHPGASVGFDHALITIRNSSGTQVYADAAALVGGNFWVDMWGWIDVPEVVT
jgi:hypothetical protein